MNDSSTTTPVAVVTPAPTSKMNGKQIFALFVALLGIAALAFAAGYGWKKGQEVAA